MVSATNPLVYGLSRSSLLGTLRYIYLSIYPLIQTCRKWEDSAVDVEWKRGNLVRIQIPLAFGLMSNPFFHRTRSTGLHVTDREMAYKICRSCSLSGMFIIPSKPVSPKTKSENLKEDMPYDSPAAPEQRKEKERTYHNFPGSKYILPADEEETER